MAEKDNAPCNTCRYNFHKNFCGGCSSYKEACKNNAKHQRGEPPKTGSGVSSIGGDSTVEYKVKIGVDTTELDAALEKAKKLKQINDERIVSDYLGLIRSALALIVESDDICPETRITAAKALYDII